LFLSVSRHGEFPFCIVDQLIPLGTPVR